jgi:hypothetical protein
MKKHYKENKDQLELNFIEAVQDFKKAGDKVVKALQELAPELSKKELKEKRDEVIEAADIRARLNKIVKIHAANKKLHWREVWRVAYSRLRDYNGFDPIVKGIAWNVTPLEACERGKQLSNLLRILEGMSGRPA